MKQNALINNQTFLTWTIISIGLAIIFINYGNTLLRNPYSNQQKNLQKLGWTITIITLLCIYITEQTIPNTQERRLINSVIIFASTFSYLYYLARQNKLT